jgi:hypothetical protein
MKRIVSVSLGSKTRDKSATVEILGQRLSLERIGTNGDMAEARRTIAKLDGDADAIGLGGIDLYLVCGKHRWLIRDAAILARAATTTPVVDGSGLKDTLERRAIELLHENGALPCAGGAPATKVLIVSAVDRFGMAETFTKLGYDCRFGDLIFALGLPIPLSSLTWIKLAAVTLLPIIARMPFRIIYPTGTKQEKRNPRALRYFTWADIIAGDFHYIRRNLPLTGAPLQHKTIITNTTTAADVETLRDLGLHRLVTTTPRIEGRSFGTNMMQAALVAVSGKPPDQLSRDDYLDMLQRMDWQPAIEILNP